MLCMLATSTACCACLRPTPCAVRAPPACHVFLPLPDACLPDARLPARASTEQVAATIGVITILFFAAVAKVLTGSSDQGQQASPAAAEDKVDRAPPAPSSTSSPQAASTSARAPDPAIRPAAPPAAAARLAAAASPAAPSKAGEEPWRARTASSSPSSSPAAPAPAPAPTAPRLTAEKAKMISSLATGMDPPPVTKHRPTEVRGGRAGEGGMGEGAGTIIPAVSTV